jgi:hypothetical protein
MKIVDGKAQFENVTCWNCKGTGKLTQGILCPNWQKTVKSKGRGCCEVCGSKNRSDHKVIGSEIVECYTCKGKGMRFEEPTDFDSKAVWHQIPVIVDRGLREQNLAEAYLGVGLWSTTDYGASQKMSDSELIADIHSKGRFSNQFCSYINQETNEVAKRIIIRLNRMGYSVIPDYKGE